MDMINKAERPIIVAGPGRVPAQGLGRTEGRRRKEGNRRCDIRPMRGHFPDDHRLSAGLSPDALMSADLVVFIGQYCMPGPRRISLQPRCQGHPRASRRRRILAATGRSISASSATKECFLES